jgi:hypothetical protein
VASLQQEIGREAASKVEMRNSALLLASTDVGKAKVDGWAGEARRACLWMLRDALGVWRGLIGCLHRIVMKT